MARRKYQDIVDHLELMILSGQLRPGDRVPAERQLMEQFRCGRSSVREALFALQRQGLLSGRTGAVHRVSAPTAESVFAEISGAVRHYMTDVSGLRQLQDARSLLEEALVRRAARTATPEAIARIAAALEANRAARTLEEFASTDLAFHTEIARASGNPLFVGLNAALAEWLRDQRLRSAAAGATFDEVVAQHEAVFRGIAARDPEAAAAAMERHLDYVVRHYWQAVLGPRPDWRMDGTAG